MSTMKPPPYVESDYDPSYTSKFNEQTFWSVYKLSSLTRNKNSAQVMKEAEEDGECGSELSKTLTLWDVVGYGVGSSIGAGIFVTTGAASLAAGPAVVLSYCLASFACLISAFCYCEFAVRVPVAGSAYTFSYVCLGEAMAWFIGWNLTLEYAISAAAVARGWSGHLQLFLRQIGIKAPNFLFDIPIGNIFSASIMSVVIILLCTLLLLRGVQTSASFSKIMSAVNVSLIIFIIIMGGFYVTPSNWSSEVPLNYSIPSHCSREASYFPCGMNGVLSGAAKCFFAYVGFDSVTTLAEEVKNPKSDMPKGIIGTLALVTSLYVGAALVLTGMQPWYSLNEDTPLASAFNVVGVDWAATFIAFTTITALSVTTLACLFGQPRIFYRMAKDGLLFRQFGVLVDSTPRFATIISGVAAAFIAFAFDLESLSEMISIGTLLAFTTVCAGVIVVRYAPPNAHAQSSAPTVVDGQYVHSQANASQHQQQGIIDDLADSNRLHEAFLNHDRIAEEIRRPNQNACILDKIAYCIQVCRKSSVFWMTLFTIHCFIFSSALEHLSTMRTWMVVLLGIACIPPIVMISLLPQHPSNRPKADSFICPLVPWLPAFGIFINIYLIASCDLMSYVRIFVWTLIGFSVYFLYGIHNSRLNNKNQRYITDLNGIKLMQNGEEQ